MYIPWWLSNTTTFTSVNTPTLVCFKTGELPCLNLRHNRAKSIAGSPCGDPWLESCKNPAVIRQLSTHPALIRRWSGKFSSQLKFAGWSADSWGNYAIRRRPPGRRPNIWRWPVGHRPIFRGKIMPKIGRSPPGHRGIIARWSHRDRAVCIKEE